MEAKSQSELPSEGLLRLKQFVGVGKAIPVSKSAWWAGVKSGRYPKPVKLGPRTTAWRVRDVRPLFETGSVTSSS